MSFDDDYRRRMSNSYLDRRQERLDLMRRQQRRTRSVYEGLIARDESKVRCALGVAPRFADSCDAAAGCGDFNGVLADIRRYRQAVLSQIDALGAFSGEVRREWRFRFDAIDPWRLSADESLQKFEDCLSARTGILRDLSTKLTAAIGLLEARRGPRSLFGLPGPADSRQSLVGLLFGPGLGAIAEQVQSLSFLGEATRQRWSAELNRIDAVSAKSDAGYAFLLGQSADINLVNAARRVLAEIESAAQCSSLFIYLSLLRSACGQYRANL